MMNPIIKMDCNFENTDALTYLSQIEDNCIDLILTDPPYIISKQTGMDMLKNKVEQSTSNIKTEQEWLEFKKNNNITNDDNKKSI